MTPTVSIIIPTYNDQRFLARTLDSILAQERPDWECVIVDDGSRDDTPAIARQYAARDGRFRFHAQANEGVAVARNRGLALSDPQAPFALFMDHDDLLLPGALARLCAAAQQDATLAGAHCVADMIDADDKPIGDGGFARFQRNRRKAVNGRLVTCAPEEPSSFAVMLVTVIWPPGVMLLRKSVLEAVGPFDGALRGASDWDMWIRVARQGPLAFVDEVLVLYRRHERNASNEASPIYREVRNVRKKAFFDPCNTPQQRREAREAYRAWQLGKIAEKKASLREAVGQAKLGESLRLSAHILLHGLYYLRGYPTAWG